MDDAEITLERNGRQGRYLLPLPGGEPARLTFVETGTDPSPSITASCRLPIADAAWR